MSGPKRTIVKCIARGNDKRGWDALCLDLDIMVHGQTLTDAREALNTAIASYVFDACHEDQADMDYLLNRRAPLPVRLRWRLELLIDRLHGMIRSDKHATRFDLPCPA